MSWSLDSSGPIYLQIVERIKNRIISGELKANDRLASVRELANEAGVNPNTMQRALTELERDGLIYSIRTTGRFVADNAPLISRLKTEIATEKTRELLNYLMGLGLGKEEAALMIQAELNKLK